ncbi:HlyC/CorC family transporter [Candidatus Sumerlaeota bacterium]|nr:HlyC/CorC family transporter [Candidatus Sumerlaeota bacterium]
MALILLAAIACSASLLASFLYFGSETAVISVNRYRLRQLHEEGDEQAGKTLKTLSNPSRLISAMLVGSNLASVLSALFFKLLLDRVGGGSMALQIWGIIRLDELLVLVAFTPMVIIFVEVFPKALLRARADAWIHFLRPFLYLSLLIFSPIVYCLDVLVRIVLMPFGGYEPGHGPRMTRGDVLLMLNPQPQLRDDLAEEEDEPEQPQSASAETLAREEAETPSFLRAPDERLLIKNIIELERTQVGEIMQPLIQLEAVHLGHTTMEAFLKQARDAGYSKYPAYKFRIVNLLGYIDVYDVIQDTTGKTDLEAFLRPAYYVPETKRVDDLLQEFLTRRIANAIVVDEYGGCCGWVTLEDILEEIVGELEDELDAPTPLIQEQPDGSYKIEGRLEIEDLNELLGTHFDDSDCDTFGGIVMKEMGRIPKEGDEIALEGWKMRIEAMEGMRVARVGVSKSQI